MVQPIPEGFHTLTPQLVVSPCAEAIDFYQKALGAEEACRIPGPGGAVMHCELKIGSSMLMCCDEFEGSGMASAKKLESTPVCLHLYVEDANAAFQRAVDAGCTAVMPVTDMFWGDRYGKVVDPYGNHWSFATHVKDVSPEEMAQAMEQMGEGCPE